MEKNQKINCTVGSCRYNNQNEQKCELQAILVAPNEGKKTMQPDESMCSSYKNEKNKE